jgi:hypothetical protein
LQKAFNLETCSKKTLVCHLIIGPQPPGRVVSEFPLNPWESIRAELIERRGKPIVSIGRWKTTAAGPQRTGVRFEFASHRIADIAKVIGDVQRALASLDVDGGAA